MRYQRVINFNGFNNQVWFGYLELFYGSIIFSWHNVMIRIWKVKLHDNNSQIIVWKANTTVIVIARRYTNWIDLLYNPKENKLGCFKMLNKQKSIPDQYLPSPFPVIATRSHHLLNCGKSTQQQLSIEKINLTQVLCTAFIIQAISHSSIYYHTFMVVV